MRLSKIELNNFMSFKSDTIELTNDINEKPTIYIIDGINYDSDVENESSSNGSGKSTLIGESVMYNIFGRGLRGNKQKVKLNEMIRNGSSKMSNIITYLINDEDNNQSNLIIERNKSIKGSSSVDVNIDGETKTKRTKRLSDKDIKMFINLTPEVFSQVVVYYHDNINLLAMNYGQRLDFFKNMVDLTLIDDYYEKAKNFKTSNERMLEKLYMSKKNTEEIISIVEDNKDEYIDYLNKKLDDLNEKLKEAESVEVSDVGEYKDLINTKKDELDSLTKEYNSKHELILIARNNLDKIEKEINRFSKLSGVKCPTCHQMVTDEYVDTISKSYISEQNEFQLIIQTNQKDTAELNSQIKDVKNSIDNYQNIINKINTELKLKEQNIRNINNDIAKIKKDILNVDNKKEDSVDKSKYELKLIGLNNAIKIREEWSESVDYWYNIFSPKSLLRSAIIRKYIAILSDIFEYYISKLYNNEILAKITISDDGDIDINIYYNGYETNYWQMSSGERKRIDISMMLSLYEFNSYINSNMPKFLIMDELLDSLDSIGIDSVIDTLVDVQKRHNIDLYLVSHIPIPLENIPETTNIKRILVTKKDKTSTVKYID